MYHAEDREWTDQISTILGCWNKENSRLLMGESVTANDELEATLALVPDLKLSNRAISVLRKNEFDSKALLLLTREDLPVMCESGFPLGAALKLIDYVEKSRTLSAPQGENIAVPRSPPPPPPPPPQPAPPKKLKITTTKEPKATVTGGGWIDELKSWFSRHPEVGAESHQVPPHLGLPTTPDEVSLGKRRRAEQ